MFLDPSELKSTIYSYQLDQIVEEDPTITIMAIESAVEEVRSYITPNDKIEWKDGRALYDVEAIFSATGTDRNSLILEICKTVTIWWVIRLANVDIIQEQVKERYDRAVKYMNDLGSGEVTLSSLPKIDPTTIPDTSQPFRFGSREKFNHE